MVFKAEVVAAFDTLGLRLSAEQATAIKVYKKLSLRNHPDRNLYDPSAAWRFQQIGRAWLICLRHYDNPEWSHEGARPLRTNNGSSMEDDDVPLDDEESAPFSQFMFEEMLRGACAPDRIQGQRYRYKRYKSIRRSKGNNRGQHRKQDRAKQGPRELREAAELIRVRVACLHAFQYGRAGQSAEMRETITRHNLNVNSNEPSLEKSSKGSTTAPRFYESMLHVSAAFCDVDAVRFLLDRGADPMLLNKSKLSPFHVAILEGNITVVSFLLQRGMEAPKVNSSKRAERDAFHPRKAAEDGRTPLQLALASSKPEIVELFIKDAAVHDVEKCWLMIQNQESIKFTAPGVVIQIMLATKKRVNHSVSMKALRRHEKEAEQAAEEAARMAEKATTIIAQARTSKAIVQLEKANAFLAQAQKGRLLKEIARLEELRTHQPIEAEELQRNIEVQARRLQEEVEVRLAVEEARREVARREVYERIFIEAREQVSKEREEAAEIGIMNLEMPEKERREVEEVARIAAEEAAKWTAPQREADERARRHLEGFERWKAEQLARGDKLRKGVQGRKAAL